MVIPSRRKGCFLSSPSRIRPSNEILTSHTSRPPSSSLSARPPFYTLPLDCSTFIITRPVPDVLVHPEHTLGNKKRWQHGFNRSNPTRSSAIRSILVFACSNSSILSRFALVASPTPGDYSRVDINFSR